MYVKLGRVAEMRDNDDDHIAIDIVFMIFRDSPTTCVCRDRVSYAL